MPDANSPAPIASRPTDEGGRGGALAWWRSALGMVVGGVLFWLAAREVAWEEFWQVIAEARWGWLALSWTTILVVPGVKGLRWKVLLSDAGRRQGWRRLSAIFCVGQLANAVIPARAGELTRAYLAGRDAPGGFGLALGAVVVEKVLDGVALLAIAGALALTMALPDWFGTAALSFAALLGLIGLGVVLLSLLKQRLLRWTERLPSRVANLAAGGLEGLSAVKGPGVLPVATVLTALVWLLGLVCNYSLFIALGLPATAAGALLLLVVHYLAVLIPGVPAQVGLFHYVTVLSLDVLAIERGLSMPYAVVLHGLIYGTIIVMGILGASMLSVSPRSLAAGSQAWRGQGVRPS